MPASPSTPVPPLQASSLPNCPGLPSHAPFASHAPPNPSLSVLPCALEAAAAATGERSAVGSKELAFPGFRRACGTAEGTFTIERQRVYQGEYGAGHDPSRLLMMQQRKLSGTLTTPVAPAEAQSTRLTLSFCSGRKRPVQVLGRAELEAAQTHTQELNVWSFRYRLGT
ncbi:unnamed protein product [Closterium sp. NIES-65]|nr:unnamed protein product [Closterium sp. NIES-65]